MINTAGRESGSVDAAARWSIAGTAPAPLCSVLVPDTPCASVGCVLADCESDCATGCSPLLSGCSPSLFVPRVWAAAGPSMSPLTFAPLTSAMGKRWLSSGRGPAGGQGVRYVVCEALGAPKQLRCDLSGTPDGMTNDRVLDDIPRKVSRFHNGKDRQAGTCENNMSRPGAAMSPTSMQELGKVGKVQVGQVVSSRERKLKRNQQ